MARDFGELSRPASRPCLTRKTRAGRPCHIRPAFAYFFILSTTAFMAAIAMAVLIAARMNGRALADANDSAKAQLLAESAVDYGLQTLAADPNWRTDYPNGLPIGPLALGEGTISFSIVDDVDGNLTNNNYDTIRIYGTGMVRNATKIYSVRCTTNTPLDCLQTTATFGGQVTLQAATIVGGSSLLLASNTGISASAVNFAGNVTLQSATNTITNPPGTGSSPSIAAGTRQLPDKSHVFDYYRSQATTIPVSSIPTANGIATMQLAVLSPANNPFSGATNPQGIYMIDCQGQTLQIANMRIVGTLIILNPGAGSGTLQSNYLSPATANFPSLMVRGDFALGSSLTNLHDNPNTGNALIPAVNYNPPAAPYLGVSDTTFTSAYPSRLEGIVYIAGNLTASNSPAIQGVLIADGTFTQTSGSLNLSPGAGQSTNPPPGFTSQVVSTMSGTWQWESVH